MALNSKRGPDPCTPALQFSLEAASVASVLGGGTMARVREGPRALEVLGEKGEMKPPPPERMSAFALDQPGSWRSAGTRVHAVSSETERRRSDKRLEAEAGFGAARMGAGRGARPAVPAAPVAALLGPDLSSCTGYGGANRCRAACEQS